MKKENNEVHAPPCIFLISSVSARAFKSKTMIDRDQMSGRLSSTSSRLSPSQLDFSAVNIDQRFVKAAGGPKTL
ncbi:hypothetical protein TorRG33x02_082130 [Trema orientale]|uniref:Uncharacterized protein n=1 Tax=Trema orientale TaxID=63057 RepID=A0A2P5FDU8_TREOI|nr:hypothetical protein TorRG33x02_082130 [Trema orientale]